MVVVIVLNCIFLRCHAICFPSIHSHTIQELLMQMKLNFKTYCPWLHEFFIDFRVKEAIAKKDKQSEELAKQRDAAVRRADYAEQLLIEQGKKLLGKN